MRTLAERISYIRELKGMNQTEFSKAIGLSERTANVSGYEKGTNEPSISTCIKIAKLGNISLNWLLTGSSALNPSLEALGNRLKEVREDLLPVELSHSEIAEKLEISVLEYLDYEDGVKEIEKDILDKYKNLFNINPDWIKHGDTESKKRNKYIVIRKGDVVEDVVVFLHYHDYFNPSKWPKNLKLIMLRIYEGDDKDTIGIILQEDAAKYYIFNHEGFMGKDSQREDQYSEYMRQALRILLGIPTETEYCDVTEENFYATIGGYKSPRLTVLEANSGENFIKQFVEHKKGIKNVITPRESIVKELENTLARRDSIIRQLKEADKEKKERTKDILRHHIKEVRDIQTIETDPHIGNIIGKVKKIYNEGTKDQRITIEALLQSFTESIEASKRINMIKKRG